MCLTQFMQLMTLDQQTGSYNLMANTAISYGLPALRLPEIAAVLSPIGFHLMSNEVPYGCKKYPFSWNGNVSRGLAMGMVFPCG